jgi:hypothetical protein
MPKWVLTAAATKAGGGSDLRGQLKDSLHKKIAQKLSPYHPSPKIGRGLCYIQQFRKCSGKKTNVDFTKHQHLDFFGGVHNYRAYDREKRFNEQALTKQLCAEPVLT